MLGSFGLILLTFLLFGLFTINLLREYKKKINDDYNNHNELILVSNMQYSTAIAWQFLTDATLTRDKTSILLAKTYVEQVISIIGELDKRNNNESDCLAKLAQLKYDMNSMYSTGIDMYNTYTFASNTGNKKMVAFDISAQKVISQVEEVVKIKKSKSATIFDSMQHMSDSYSNLAIILSAFFTLTSIFIALFFTRHFTYPIKQLEIASNKIASGDLDFSLNIKNKDEFAGLAAVFNKMARHIKKSTEELSAEKEELKVTLRSIGDGVITTDKDDLIILVNRALENITGWSFEDLAGRQIVELFELVKADYSVYAGKNNLSTIFGMNANQTVSETLEIISKDRTKKIILCSSARVVENNNTLKGFVYVLKDITEQVNVETQLQLSQKMESIGQLAAGIAHEINTPMQYINDNTSFVKDAFISISKYLDIIDKESTNDNPSGNRPISEAKKSLDIEYLINEIPVAISQSQMGIQRVTGIVLAMKDFAHPGLKEKNYSNINHSIEVSRTLAKNEWKYVSDLELNFDPSLAPVFCNIDEINQVLLNMIINAAHAIKEKIGPMPEVKGKIIISTSQDQDFIEINIQDTGAGIKDENLNRIFDPFFTTKEVGRGTGQGLAIAHNIIVNNHKGNIFVDSIVNSGTSFTIKLPINEPV
jgi:PAS domain S-box-containing protein